MNTDRIDADFMGTEYTRKKEVCKQNFGIYAFIASCYHCATQERKAAFINLHHIYAHGTFI